MNKSILFILLASIIYSCNNVQGEKVPAFSNSSVRKKHVPLFVNRMNHDVLEIEIIVPDTMEPLSLNKIFLQMGENSSSQILKSIEITHLINEEKQNVYRSSSGFSKSNKGVEIHAPAVYGPGLHILSVGFEVKEDALLSQSFTLEGVDLEFDEGSVLSLKTQPEFNYRPAVVLRAAGQDNCDTYRIPGLITTSKGTLIAVYDNRYNSSKDLQGNIDVGMSRSTDGGQSWESMRIIMDMGKWGGRAENLNGIGDPSVLYDPASGSIWVAGLWMSGLTEKDMLWWASRPGIKPEETGQFILVKSTDDGLTWSAPINITKQIKDPSWQLMFQGPGRGITLEDGTLVFPAQFKADIGKKALDGGQFTSHSTIVYSKNGGETWHIGTGAKPNTTEAQVVQLADGSLMLNMRDDRNRRIKDETNGRAVSVTSDFGKTWTLHSSSNSALPEPNCMASLIAADISIDGKNKQVLFFSNPNDKESRTNITIKASLDGGNTWPEEYWVELNEAPGFGYSCMTMVDENTIGILYEGRKELYFQKVPVQDVLGIKKK